MKNKKLLILLLIVLLIIVAMVISRNSDDNGLENGDDRANEDQLQDDAALMNGGENGEVAGATDANLVGVWRSGEDPKYILEFATGGVAREYYARQLTATGSWSLSNGVLSTSIGGASRSYDLTALSESTFSARYQTSDVTIQFNRVEL